MKSRRFVFSDEQGEITNQRNLYRLLAMLDDPTLHKVTLRFSDDRVLEFVTCDAPCETMMELGQ